MSGPTGMIRCEAPGCGKLAVLWNDHGQWSCSAHARWLADHRLHGEPRKGIVWDKDAARMAS